MVERISEGQSLSKTNEQKKRRKVWTLAYILLKQINDPLTVTLLQKYEEQEEGFLLHI